MGGAHPGASHARRAGVCSVPAVTTDNRGRIPPSDYPRAGGLGLRKLASWFGDHPLRPAIACIAAILLLGAAGCITGPARNDRDWYPYLARGADVEQTDQSFTVTPVSAWSYAREGPTAET